jgi:hypothetical protein
MTRLKASFGDDGHYYWRSHHCCLQFYGSKGDTAWQMTLQLYADSEVPNAYLKHGRGWNADRG